MNLKYQRLFSIAITIVLLLGLCAISFAFKNTFQQQPQKYTVTLTVNEWQAVIGAIITPDDYSNNAKKQVSELIQKNMVAVAADTTKPKK